LVTQSLKYPNLSRGITKKNWILWILSTEKENMQAIFHEFNKKGEFGNTLIAKDCETHAAGCFTSIFK